MPGFTYSNEELNNFLMELLQSKLAVAIFNQLVEDGGNTVIGLVESLQEKGVKASKTRVYEEISILLAKGMINRVSKRPPVYTINLSRENLEELASKFFMDTREELLRRWAATYPFLPEFLKTSQDSSTSLSSIPMINFNPYPIVDVFKADAAGLQKYILRVFESNTILISHSIIDTLISTDDIRLQFEKENFKSLFTIMQKNFERNEKITLKIIANIKSKEIANFTKLKKIPDFYKKYFQLINYELREPTNNLSSFVIGDDKILLPIGIGGASSKTYLIIEIRDAKMVRKARSAFSKEWNKAKSIVKIENGQIIRI
ncbi:MAG: hypothetical protein ACTSQK_10295 [Candidatus Heimdallarchaeota archaeon]